MKPQFHHLAVTLSHVAPKQWRSTREICHRHTDEAGTIRAIFNRLQKLRADGMVQEQRRGREKFWRRVC
jgi:hypothetical protein